MTREEIEDAVCDVMREYGPDGHIDGYDQLTDLVLEVRAAERERCAKIAEKMGYDHDIEHVGVLIAAKIRSGA